MIFFLNYDAFQRDALSKGLLWSGMGLWGRISLEGFGLQT